jgi:hypothetical protein
MMFECSVHTYLKCSLYIACPHSYKHFFTYTVYYTVCPLLCTCSFNLLSSNNSGISTAVAVVLVAAAAAAAAAAAVMQALVVAAG